MVGRDVEALEDLVQHRAVLRGDTDARLQPFRRKSQPADHRAEFDCLGPRPEDKQDGFHERTV